METHGPFGTLTAILAFGSVALIFLGGLLLLVMMIVGPIVSLTVASYMSKFRREVLTNAFAVAAVLVVLGGSVAVVMAELHVAPPSDEMTVIHSAPLFDEAPDSAIANPALRASVQRGRAILLATRDSLPEFVGDGLRCTSCHLDGGLRKTAMSWVGTYARFPQYRAREGRVLSIQDRVNGCLRRSMNGKPLPVDSREMDDIVAYLAYLSTGVKVSYSSGKTGLPIVAPPTPPDSARGRVVYATTCARCHGTNGEGMAVGTPLWGSRSFNIGAGMARVRTAAAFIQLNMPVDRPRTLSERDAFDVAAFMVSQPRPDFPGKEHDWPVGGAPPDSPYRTRR